MTQTLPTCPLDKHFQRLFGIGILLLWALCVVFASNAANPPSPISIFVLDAKTGQPISKITVFLFDWDEKGAEHGLGKQVTNKNGAAEFELQEPLPERIGISFSPDQAKSCSDIAYSARDILNSGVLARNNCGVGKPDIRVKSKAGLLMVFASRVTLDERLHREMP
jgi:hypothetical protein